MLSVKLLITIYSMKPQTIEPALGISPDKKIKLTLFWANERLLLDSEKWLLLIKYANEFFNPIGLYLDIFPTLFNIEANKKFVLNYNNQLPNFLYERVNGVREFPDEGDNKLFNKFTSECGKLRQLAHLKFDENNPDSGYKVEHKRLPVIFSEINYVKEDFEEGLFTMKGYTLDYAIINNSDPHWLRYVVINLNNGKDKHSTYNSTLAHEIGHAAFLDHTCAQFTPSCKRNIYTSKEQHNPQCDKLNLMFPTINVGIAPSSIHFTMEQLIKLSNAYFISNK